MTYYKIIVGDKYVGTASTYDLRKVQKKHKIIVVADEQTGQFLQVGDNLYHDDWMAVIPESFSSYSKATVTVIQEDEYDTLNKSAKTGDVIQVNTEDPETTTTSEESGTTVERTSQESPMDRIRQLEAQVNELSEKIKQLENQ